MRQLFIHARFCLYHVGLGGVVLEWYMQVMFMLGSFHFGIIEDKVTQKFYVQICYFFHYVLENVLNVLFSGVKIVKL